MRDYILKLDVTDAEVNIDELWFIKDDVGGYILLELTDAGEIIDLSNSNVVAICEKKDRTVTQKALDITGSSNKAMFKMEKSIIDLPGKVKIAIKIYQGENITTFSPFNITVKKSISMDEVVESYTELDVLQIVLRNEKDISLNKESIEELKVISEFQKNRLEKLEEDTAGAIVNINKTIEIVDEKLDNKIIELGNSTVEEVQRIDENLLNNDKEIENIKMNKVDIIISENQPDITNLKLGTIWIKPIVESNEK